MAYRPRLAMGIGEIDCRRCLPPQSLVIVQQGVQARGYRKAVLGQFDGGLEQTGPRQAAMLGMHQSQHRHHARHTHRTAAVDGIPKGNGFAILRSEEHTSELQSLMRISYAVFCLKKKKTTT